jgi:hypothetical protein
MLMANPKLRALIFALTASLLWGVTASALIPKELDDIIKRQAQVASALGRVARNMNAEDAFERKLQEQINRLAVSETVSALEALEGIAKSKTAKDAKPHLKKLTDSQERIIDALKRILGIVSQLKEENVDPLKKERSSDLSDLEKEKYKDLKDKLKEFIKQQKKVIDGTTSLAKTAVEDFTPEQEEKLKQLEATEDQWSKFLKDTVSDLSKIPEQDMSNPNLLKEIVEIYTEIDKAKDAIKKKTLEIAVPAEEAGAENAETLTHNLEKWLMDTPDRIRWQMEEPLADYEIPNAELPEELQDIVGPLMENEEDLMDDIEDATSGWGDSLNKGAGWTAMDGPISNFSAKGVTGNMMPNSSEIGGRSGEGRSGKSAGEFVEKSAVGKGGRKTPTRLTPDAFEKGVVDDKSPDATGGSTGGGKISGGGAEGLEGPPPPQMKQQMNRLAGKQADLRNRAEKVKVALERRRYPTGPIDNVIRQMTQMETALRSGRVREVTRMRKVIIKDVQDTRAYFAGETRVSRDTTANLPPKLRGQIMDAMDDPSPKAYETLLKAYFEKLARPE